MTDIMQDRQLYMMTMMGDGYIKVDRHDVLLEIPEGWGNIVCNLITDLFDAGWDGKIDQIKEKFGSLRFYIPYGNDQIFDLIDAAEAQTTKVCMVCGEPATTTTKGWYTHRCEAHKDT